MINIKLLRTALYSSLILINLEATSLRDSVETVLNFNPDVMMENLKQSASETKIDKERSAYYPSLDLELTYEGIKTIKRTDQVHKIDDATGTTATLTFEQLIYDEKVKNKIQESQYNHYNVKYTSKDTVEKLLLDTVNAYMKLVSYQEVIAINNFKINTHERYLKLAKEKKELTNDTLDFYQVRAKIQVLEDKTLEEEVNKQKTLSKYKKLTGNNLSGEICRPRINEKLLPLTLEEAISQVLAKNNQLRAQKEMVRKQTSKLIISESNFMPTLKLVVEASHNKDLITPETGTEVVYSAKVQSNWNLYNGGKDVASAQIEKINILQEKKILDSLKNDVVDQIKSSYNAYWKLKKRIENLENLNISNKVIVNLYSQQLDSGDKTFLDLLDAEKELFRTTLLLKTTEFKLYNEYYSILHSLDMLSDSILMEKNQVCNKYVFNDSIFKSSY